MNTTTDAPRYNPPFVARLTDTPLEDSPTIRLEISPKELLETRIWVKDCLVHRIDSPLTGGGIMTGLHHWILVEFQYDEDVDPSSSSQRFWARYRDHQDGHEAVLTFVLVLCEER